MTDERAVADLLDDRPDLEAAVAAALETDAAADEPWTFDDVALDSGAFGELVAAGVVVERDGGYRVAHPEAARAALAGEAPVADEEPSPRTLVPSLPSIDVQTAGGVTAAVAFVVLLRLLPWPTVFQPRAVVLTSNDPYFYRFLVERALADGLDAAIGPGMGEPLYVATAWLVAAALGGTATVGHLLAIYPVVSAAITAVLVYGLAVVATGDRRVGVASVVMLAVLPGHAIRTALGFADHHAFDYPWLVLTALALAALGTDRWRRPAAAALSVGVAGQVLAWQAGPLLVLPVGGVVLVAVVQDVAADRPPARENTALLAGLVGAAILAAGAHLALGWQSDVVAYAPAGLAVGATGAVALGEAWTRRDLPARSLAGVFAGGTVATVLVVRLVPPVWSRARAGLRTLTDQRAIAETLALFSAESFGFLFLFGLALFLALGTLPYAVARTVDGDRAWAVVSVYAGWFLGLALFQVRFAGELSPFVAVLTGYAFVYLAAKVDVARPPAAAVRRLRWPGGGAAVALVVLFALVGGFGLLQVPLKTSQILIEDDEYETAMFLADDAEQRGLAYPQDFVLSQWGHNRMYNYFVNGRSRSYSYARATHVDFLLADDPAPWYDRFAGRVGYVVVERRGYGDDAGNYRLLAERYGSRGPGGPGSGHFRARRVAADGSPVAVEVVPGATVRGTAAANRTVTVRTDVAIPGAEFTYERRVTAVANGTWTVTVAYPGRYRVTVGGEDRGTVTVPESAVRSGGSVGA